MKKILVPTDFSECAQNAEKYAFFLAQKIDAELVFLHVINTPVDWSKLTKEQEDLFPDAKEAIAQSKKRLNELIKQAESDNIKSRKILIFNNTNEKIHRFVEEEHIDLVVMGSHGVYGFKDYILGTNTYSMIRNSKVPVIVVKKLPEKLKLEKLVLATNFKEETGPTFRMVENLMEILQVKLKVLFVNTPTYFLETNDIMSIGKTFLNEFASYEHEIHIIDSFKEERGVIQFAEKINADGIAIITYGKSDFKQYFSPSVSENLIGLTEMPVLSIKVAKK
ncbi:universal stress protein [Cognataquiflexum rubidum]|uniref:universal stress protein n=1 Tax=Cognataquiflexum rubidum TaxID=2922273 RepID=UPI001F143492|nr:universal stress protein [Cognataquiflexum rubidum]MCH6234445.1 universal stress protein [Cognataquiflexum rubidum]